MLRPPFEPNGYQMIENAEIQNFRCFEAAELSDCRRINVIVGRNAVGKTALLEALFLTAAVSPEIAIRLRTWRGYEGSVGGSFEQVDAAIWDNLFFRFDRKNKINISLSGTEEHRRSLKIAVAGGSEVFVPTASPMAFAPIPPGRFGASALEWIWTLPNGHELKVRPQFYGGGYQFPGTENEVPSPVSFFASSHPFPNQENVNRFSNISKRRGEGPVIAAIIKAFPFIRDIDIQAHAGVSMLHADIPSLPEKIALGGVSSGVLKFATILVAIAEKPKSIILVDEIENGIHFSLYERYWRTLYEFARDNDVQIFATTHSSECLEHLTRAIRRTAGDLSIIRTEMDEDGRAQLKQFYGSAVIDGIAHGEVR
jgi:AAA15 family ATPase/GTPase